MNASHQREAAIFDAAMESPPEQRAAHLDQACGGDAALRRHVESLLKAGESQCVFLDAPPCSSKRSSHRRIASARKTNPSRRKTIRRFSARLAQ